MKRRTFPWVGVRRTVQTAVFALFVYVVWTTRYPLDAFVNPRIFFQLDPLIMGLTALAERIWLPGLIWAGATLLATLVFGRVFCGWFCPLGACQDAAAWLAGRFRRFREGAPGRARFVKYLLLGALTVLAAAGVQWGWFFDPLAVTVRALSYHFSPAVNVGVDRFLQALVQASGGWLPLEQFYYTVTESFLDIRFPFYPQSGLVLVVFLLILAGAAWRRRAWCRWICPLGALLGLVSRFAWLRRRTGACRGDCGRCRDVCRTNAIAGDNRTDHGECVMCLDCMETCPRGVSSFAWVRPGRKPEAHTPGGPDMTRAAFLGVLGGSAAALSGCLRLETPATRPVVRPPGALPEEAFVHRCIRCGNCLKVCLTNVLQPALPDAGWAGLWTPAVNIPESYCEYRCNLCGQVCPTGALTELAVDRKVRTPIGRARVLRDRCLPWAQGMDCIVCEEHCPVPEKAIKLETVRLADGRSLKRPYVDPALCIGCGLCAHKCPVLPDRAIHVQPEGGRLRRRRRSRGS